MRLARVPLRISLAGGGSDLPSHYEQHGGAVVSFTIDKYIYITAKPNLSLFPHRYRLVYSKVEECNNRSDIIHPIIRQLVNDYSVGALDLDVMSDIPAGTGMGSSSAFTVGLHHALGSPRDKHELAELACETEIGDLKEPIGKQDQYAAAFGGLNYFGFNKDRTIVKPIVIPTFQRDELLSSLSLFFIGGSRSASQALVEQQHPDNYSLLNDMADLAEEASILLTYNCGFVGGFLKEGWELKKRLSPNVSNERIDAIIGTALDNGATGGKLLGAGGAGFVLLFCEPSKRDSVFKALKEFNLTHVPFNLDTEGSKILYEG